MHCSSIPCLSKEVQKMTTRLIRRLNKNDRDGNLYFESAWRMQPSKATKAQTRGSPRCCTGFGGFLGEITSFRIRRNRQQSCIGEPWQVENALVPTDGFVICHFSEAENLLIISQEWLYIETRRAFLGKIGVGRYVDLPYHSKQVWRRILPQE
jgi:hypothetical protein